MDAHKTSRKQIGDSALESAVTGSRADGGHDAPGSVDGGDTIDVTRSVAVAEAPG